MESLYNRLSGQARRLLDNFLDKWSWTKDDNPYILEAIAREEDRAVWRNYYMERAVYNLNRVYMAMPAAMPTRPDQLGPYPRANGSGGISRNHPICLPDGISSLLRGFESFPVVAKGVIGQVG